MDDHKFVKYYEAKSVEEGLVAHFERLRELLLRMLGSPEGSDPIRVLDIGCNAGTFTRVWSQAGCRVSGVDINEELIQIARERAAAGGESIDFRVASAESLPWPNTSFDIVVMPELLEHVVDWRSSLAEAARVLRPRGILYVSTTNRLCPRQEEFSLPLYSWYPGWLKRRCVKMSLTTHREWVSFTQFPAVTWFDPYSLGAEFRRVGLEPLDRFDIFARYAESRAKRLVGRIATIVPPVRFAGHVLSPGTRLAGRKGT